MVIVAGRRVLDCLCAVLRVQLHGQPTQLGVGGDHVTRAIEFGDLKLNITLGFWICKSFRGKA